MNKKYSFNQSQKKPATKKLLAAFLVVLAVALLGFWFYSNQKDTSNNDGQIQDDSGINYNPPSEEEKNAGDEIKAPPARDQSEQDIAVDNQDRLDDEQMHQASVIIIDANQYDGIVEARAFISDFFQKGTCTFTFTQGGLTHTEKTEAFTDSSTTNCRNVSVPASTFPTMGEWTLVVTYESDDAKGQSDQRTLIIE